MMSMPACWPYDEVQLSFDAEHGKFVVEAPWIRTVGNAQGADAKRIQRLADHFQAGTLGPQHLVDINWFFQALAALPLCYILPRKQWPQGLSSYALIDTSLLGLQPKDFLLQSLGSSPHVNQVKAVSDDEIFQGDWKWDLEGALQFSSAAGGIDPQAFFSVARRYHLLSSVDDNKTAELYAYVRGLDASSDLYKHACALMVRQNHYVTCRCDEALTPALQTAKEARPAVQAFINAEFGHDRILDVALKSMGLQAEEIPVTNQSKTLMDLLQFAAHRNFLGFAMSVDFFERSAYQKEDPLASLLSAAGFTQAARQINKHMDINDEGGHENVAIDFLSKMAPVEPGYAEEALRIAELVTNALNRMATGVSAALAQRS